MVSRVLGSKVLIAWFGTGADGDPESPHSCTTRMSRFYQGPRKEGSRTPRARTNPVTERLHCSQVGLLARRTSDRRS